MRVVIQQQNSRISDMAQEIAEHKRTLQEHKREIQMLKVKHFRF